MPRPHVCTAVIERRGVCARGFCYLDVVEHVEGEHIAQRPSPVLQVVDVAVLHHPAATQLVLPQTTFGARSAHSVPVFLDSCHGMSRNCQRVLESHGPAGIRVY